MPYAIKKEKKLHFTNFTRGLKNLRKKTHYNQKKGKIIIHGCLIAQMKRLDALITMYKKCQLFKLYRCWENHEKNTKKCSFLKKNVSCGVFLDFISNSTLQRVEFFCIIISASRRFIGAVKHHHTIIFMFWVIMYFLLKFFIPPVREVKCEVLIFSKYFLFSNCIRNINHLYM